MFPASQGRFESLSMTDTLDLWLMRLSPISTKSFIMPNRRNFLKAASLIPVVAATGSSVFAQTQPIRRFHAPAPCLVGLNAYSFSKQLNNVVKGRSTGGGKANGKGKGNGSGKAKTSSNSDAMTLQQLLDYCVDPEHTFDAVDITGYYFPNYSASEATVPPDAFVDEIKNRASDLGLAICGTGIGNSLTGVPFDREGKNGIVFSTDEGGDRATIENEIVRIKAWIEVAARLGAPVLRVFTGLEPSYLMKEHVKPDDPQKEEKATKLQAWRAATFAHMADDLGDIVEHAKKFGVIIGIQNHGDFLKTANETIELIEAVNSEWIGVIVDTGYFLTPDPYLDVERVLPYAVNFQVKEYVRKSPTEYAAAEFHPIDMMRLVKIVRNSKYQGYLPIETVTAGTTESMDPYVNVPALLKKLRAAIQETA